ncbi:sulfite exporter TauE/SafE family protein [Glaciecola petra]|uniref:Sulfite exporter TauE/SafE family protein n=1 Tax=Glaciecola petra TaxID=3075602 RepID=A0ABU2ZNQ8_9ALTE|nr:sulfite exporter TauE/SafE family protein [Aestuariibacter sp. P117]MDT0594255.1 sulfite exporter TauE/SafE family protein [Aestuariibacter sp. P117]
MTDFSLLTAFFMGLAGGVHCIGMCGGIASAFTFATPKNSKQTPYIFAYNIGRILSYTIAGAITGYLSSIFTAKVVFGLYILQIISIFFLLLLALYISGILQILAYFERLGGYLWQKIAPIGKSLIPFKSPWHTVLYGMLWGWLPCGLVYTALTWSLASGDSLNGAVFMLCFGIGTLPALIASSVGASFVIPYLQHKNTRLFMAFLILIFAIFLTFKLFQGIK